MLNNLDNYLAVILAAFLVVYLLTPQVRSLAVHFGVIDKPDARRPHKRPTARGGGLAVVIGVHIACALTLGFTWVSSEAAIDRNWWGHYLAASSILLVVGVIDDVRGMRPTVKLAGQILAASVICHAGTRFGSLFGIELPWLLDCAMVVFWIVAVINAFNLIDGLDGLASGLTIISATGLCGVFIAMGHVSGGIVVLAALIGGSLGFLRYNFYPASIFLGDTGSMFLGLTLGAISLQTFNKNALFLSLTIPLLVLGIPLYDSLLAIWRRSVRMWLPATNADGTPKKRGIMQPDVEHIHHRLLKMGLSTPRVATSLFILSGGLVFFGLLMATFESHRAGIFLFALLLAVYVLMRHLAVIELHDTGRVILTGIRRPTHSTFKALSYPVWDMFCLIGSMAFIMWAIESVRVNFWHTWFLELPIWVTPTFCLLATSRSYITVWDRARVLDVLILIGTLEIGVAISLGVALLIDPSNASQWVVRAIILAGLSHPAIVGLRVIYRVTEELVNYFRTPGAKINAEKILLYGAGGRCQLYIKERNFNTSPSNDGSVIVGLIDDEPLLRHQWVYGFKVLGNSKDLASLVSHYKINRIVITAALRPESQDYLRQIGEQLKLRITEWHFSEVQFNIQPKSVEQPR